VSWIARVAAGTLHPNRVENALCRLEQAWPADFPALEGVITDFPAGPGVLPALLAISPISAEKIIKDPGTLLWLSRPDVCASERGPGRIRRDLDRERAAGFDPEFAALRRIKNREMLRIALRDVARLSPLEQTMYEITAVAEVCLHEVCEGWLAELTRRWGDPQTDICVIAMGKLGGEELNYSSDIDVFFAYGEDGALKPSFTRHEFFARLAEKMIGTFTAASAAGPLFRIDLRLRPEGAAGPPVRSLESIENYYAGFGETWERMALIKSRAVAGSSELFYEFAHRLQPFVYPRSLTPDVLDEIAAIKARIERAIPDELERNVKLGRGGIREIEFTTQALQLLNGARHAFLQERNTLKALRALRQLDYLAPGEMESLSAAYRFLRDVEHRLQIAGEEQTHTLPAAGAERELIARSLGFAGERDFDDALRAHTGAVRAIFEKFLQGNTAVASVRNLALFQDIAGAERELRVLGQPGGSGHVSPRTRGLYAKLEPLLLAGLGGLADPDAALHRFVRFVERYGIRGLLFETLVTHPRLLELLLRLFDSGPFLTEILMRRPQLLEETTRTGTLGRALDVATHLAGLARREEAQLAPGDWARVYRRAQLLRIGLRDLLGFADIGQVQREYSALAEACVIHTHQELGLDNAVTVIAMGKFGGAELSYGCDLDIVLVGDDPARASELVKAMTTQTAEGILFPVDTRLRPEGDAGLLAVPLEAFRTYYKSRAQPWEIQALTKSRPVCGPEMERFATLARESWREFSQRVDPMPAIREMHARVVRERAGPNPLLAFKTGIGGLMEFEFHIQGMQMRHGVWEPNTIRALDALAAAGEVTAGTVTRNREDYLFLRKCEAVIRRADNSSISSLPPEDMAQRQLGIRLGFDDRESFIARYREARESIRAWCAGL
jgi:glutamate-ammonia-ligase adenylyltransferase